MKNLKDSILEKLKVDEIILDKKFPIDGKIDDIIKFLEEKGFKLIKTSDANSIFSIFNIHHKKCIYIINNILWFADTSKERISRDNPIFFINCNYKNNYVQVYTMNDIILDVIVEDDKKEFLKELNKRFDW